MIFCKLQCLIAVITLAASCACGGQELLKNNNWDKLKNGTPASWRFFNYKGNGQSTVKLVSETFKNSKVAVIDSSDITGRGYIGQKTNVQLPADKNIVISGYYRTENIALGPKGMLRVDITYNYASKDKTFPKKHQAILLKPSKVWKKFESVKDFNFPIKDFYAFFMLNRASGKIYFNGLSLKVQESSSKIDSQEKYVWREAENICKYGSISNWGKDIKDYYSGKGGVILKKEPFKWSFRIKEEVNQSTLMPQKRNYFVWLRMYGYMEKPVVSVFFNKTKISSFKTQANEQVKNGRYAGPGKYYWQKAGSFSAVGGNASMKIVPQGRMLLDAIVVTSDSKYAPLQYEAKKAAEKIFFADIKTAHVMKSIYKVYGISDKVTTPLVFHYQGKMVKIPNDQKSAVFHVAIPDNILVKNISSVWAGKTWNRPDRWGNKYLTWKKTGTKLIDGVNHSNYEIYLYNLGLYYTIFVQADKTTFQEGKKLSCKYYLEYKGKKQLVETVPLRTVALKASKAFKTIMIGPAGGNGRGFYESFPDIAKDMVFSGMNVINPWHLSPNESGGRWEKLRKQCLENKIMILGEYSPFHGSFAIKDKKFQAVSLSGKSVYGRSAGGRPALCINEESEAFRKALNYLSDQGRQGVTGMVLDDENFNQKKDKFDYSDITKRQFKKYLEKQKIAYVDPVLIVKNKKKYASLYKAWVDFKCDCMVEMYRKYKKAYLKGFVEAPSSTTFGKKLFIAQILKNKTAEESRINSYWDYKKLAAVCDYISPMIYTYQGVKDSAQIGDIIEMYNKYIGKKVIAPTLLCEHSGFGNVDITQKRMFKYQILESLMQQSKIIFFWYGSAVYNPINSQYISEAIRWGGPYEDIILNGKEYKGIFSTQKWARIKGLKLGKRILLYVANYRNSISKKAQIKLNFKVKSILEIGTDKKLPVKNNSFSVDFKSDRGKLFLITQ
jgi:hypothetical protein